MDFFSIIRHGRDVYEKAAKGRQGVWYQQYELQ